ncbi:hypothetical protein SUGI_0469190 [Cryptomeria japonica]|nr:hypothetical protein SUGI_0469190 [Cryptomeria japonica]
MVPRHVSDGSRNKFDVRGIRRDDKNCLKWNGFTLKDIAGKTAWHPFFQVMRIQQATRRILDDCKWLNRDDDDQLPYENIYGLKLLALQNSSLLQRLNSISVDSLPRSSCTDFLTCAPNISTAVLSGKSMKMEAVDKMDRVARRFEGIKVRSSLESAQLERTVKLKGAIFLYLITDQDCNIEVTFFGHVYTAHSSRFEYPVHILMWTKDSEVYKDFKSSSDKARDFSWLKTPIKKGWIVQAENSEVCKRFTSYLFVEGYI